MTSLAIFPVPGRELHEVAGVATPFHIWIKRSIRNLELENENDYVFFKERLPHKYAEMLQCSLNVESALLIAGGICDQQKRDGAFLFIRQFYTPAYQQWRKFINLVRGRSTELPF